MTYAAPPPPLTGQPAMALVGSPVPAGMVGLGPNFGDIYFPDGFLHIGGKLQAEEPLVVDTSPHTPLGTAGDIRRLYVDLRGNYQDFVSRLQFGTSSGSLNVAWAYVGYHGWKPDGDKPADIWFGYQKTLFGLDSQTADENRIFTEGPLPSQALAPGKAIGLSLQDYGSYWQGAIGAFNGAALTAPTSPTDNGWQFAGRLIVDPLKEEGMVAHIGGSFSYTKSPNTSSVSGPKTQPEEDTVATSLVSTGTVTGIQSLTNAGVEGSFEYGPALLQGEWINEAMDRSPKTKATPSDPYFSGWYTQASYVLTGEAHEWEQNKGTYGNVTPASPFDPLHGGGWGAWEVAARYSYLNLWDIGGLGTPSSASPQGKESNFTTALNWYLNTHVRGELDWTHVFAINAPTNFKPNFNGLNADIVELRMQLVF